MVKGWWAIVRGNAKQSCACTKKLVDRKIDELYCFSLDWGREACQPVRLVQVDIFPGHSGATFSMRSICIRCIGQCCFFVFEPFIAFVDFDPNLQPFVEALKDLHNTKV